MRPGDVMLDESIWDRVMELLEACGMPRSRISRAMHLAP
jgi:hypothetical protein